MKKFQRFIKIAGLFAIAALMAACPSSFDPPSGGEGSGLNLPEGMGMISLSIAGRDARTLFPAETEDFEYEVTIQKGTENAVVDGADLDEVSGEFEVPANTGYTVTIEAFYDFGDGGTPERKIVGRVVIEDVDVADGDNTELKDVLMIPVEGGGP